MSVRENRLSDPEKIQAHQYRLLLGERGRGWVAEREGRVVGFAIADRTRSSVWALFVEPGHDGHGVGRRLHDLMLNWLFESGAELVWLGTEARTRAERFYVSARWSRGAEEADGEVRFEMSGDQWRARSQGPALAEYELGPRVVARRLTRGTPDENDPPPCLAPRSAPTLPRPHDLPRSAGEP